MMYDNNSYWYNHITINRVIDGDTVRVNLDLGMRSHMVNLDVRIKGIDTPEIRGGTVKSKAVGFAARDFVVNWLRESSALILESTKWDKYGRILGTFHEGDDNLTTDLLIRKLAIPYGTKWTDELLDEAIDANNVQVQLI